MKRISCYLFGMIISFVGIYLFKTVDPFIIGYFVFGIGIVIVGIVQIYPEPTKSKYKLKEKHIEEIVTEVGKDTLIRELTFLENERTEELVEYVDGMSFEDALIVVKSIETKYPSITIGRGIEI